MLDDKHLTAKNANALATANPLLLLARNGPVVIKSKIGKAQFHQFLLHHEELKIERDKHGIIIIHPPMTPDFVMEVRSKTDSVAKLKKKMTEAWMANGVQLAWLIDPRSQKAWIYRTGLPIEEIVNFDALLSGEPLLPGFQLDLRDFR